MLLKIAWKNIWRNTIRSAILIMAIGLGIWALIFINGITAGMVNGYVDNAIQNRTAHIQIHHPLYDDEKLINHYFDDEKIGLFLHKADFIKEYSERIIVDGMISSPRSSQGITLYGVNTEKERRVSHLDERIDTGQALNTNLQNALLISRNLADKLGVTIRSKVVINFQNKDRQVTASAFRIAGIIRNVAGKADESLAYVSIDQLRKLTGMDENKVHEVAVLTQNLDQVAYNQETIAAAFPDLSVKNYAEIAPDLALLSSQIELSLTIMIIIFMLALIFGIINTMLMAVLERYKELGMLMAVGMKKGQVFAMVVIETVLISIVGVPFGMVLGALTIAVTHKTGINLTKWTEGLNQYGIVSQIYPALSIKYYFIIGLAVLITAVLASIYPARKATKLNPIQALRKI